MKPFTTLLLLSTLCMSVFGQDDEVKIRGTDLCTADEVAESGAEIDECYKQSALNLTRKRFSFDAILEDGLTGVYQQRCEYLNMQLACDDKIVKKCLQPNRVESFKLKTVEDERDRAIENPEILGAAYIRSCDALRNYEINWVLNVFGTTKCSFNMGKRLLSEKKTCEERTIAFRRLLFSTSGLNADDMKLIYCNYNKALKSCGDSIRDCFSPEEKANQDEDRREFSESLQTSIRTEIGSFIDDLSNFSFETDCPVVNDEGETEEVPVVIEVVNVANSPRSRRAAMASEPVGPEVLEAAGKVFSMAEADIEQFLRR